MQRTKDIGVNFQSATGISDSVLGVGALNFGNLQNALGNPLGLTGLGLGLASGSKCSVPVEPRRPPAPAPTTASTVTVPCDIALMTALQTDTHSNVLSAPTLLTADNEEAMIVVGQNLPFVGSSAANAGIARPDLQLRRSPECRHHARHRAAGLAGRIRQARPLRRSLQRRQRHAEQHARTHDHHPLGLDHGAGAEPSHRRYRRPALERNRQSSARAFRSSPTFRCSATSSATTAATSRNTTCWSS